MLNLFEPSGYVDIPGIKAFARKNDIYFLFIYGGRGTGKTYGELQDMIRSGIYFLYLRRLGSQYDILKTPEGMPFKALNHDNGWNIDHQNLNKQLAAFYEMEPDPDGKLKPAGAALGLMSSLSTFANLRSVDFSQVQELILDEFIPQPGERPIRNEAEVLFNAYETVNRNRELKGEQPVMLVCLANSNELANPVFMELGLVREAEKLRKDGREYKILPERHMMLVDLAKSKISEEKSHTVLYDLTRGTEFYDMAIKNAFAAEERGRIQSRPLKEYKPLVSVGEITIYKHKSRREYYCTTHRSGNPKTFGAGSKELLRFRSAYGYIWDAYIRNDIIFEEYLAEILFDKYFNFH